MSFPFQAVEMLSKFTDQPDGEMKQTVNNSTEATLNTGDSPAIAADEIKRYIVSK
jgi:hypothetical protein